MCANPRCNNWPMYAVVKWPRDMALSDMVYLPICCNIVCLNFVPDPLSRFKNQRYNACIHDCWAMIKDTCYTRHHII